MALLRKYSDYIILILVVVVLILLLIMYTDIHLALIDRDVEQSVLLSSKPIKL